MQTVSTKLETPGDGVLIKSLKQEAAPRLGLSLLFYKGQ